MGWAEQIISHTTSNSNDQTHSSTSPSSLQKTQPLCISVKCETTKQAEMSTIPCTMNQKSSTPTTVVIRSSSRWMSPRPLTSMDVSHRPDLDTPSCTGAEVRIHLNSTQQPSPPSQNFGKGGTGYHHQQGGGASAEKSHRTCPRSKGFLQQYIPSFQEGWWLEICHRPASPEQVHPETPLQDGVSIESPRFYHPR